MLHQSSVLTIALTAGLLGFAPTASAQTQRQSRTEETFTFEMRGKPWGAVFEWLTDKTGIPFIPRDIPTGTFNFIARKDQKLTIPQVIDIINDGLILQNYLLINRGTSFTVVPADLEISPFLLPQVAPAELRRHGRTEIVSTIVKLKVLGAEEMAAEVKKQMGPFGKVVPLSRMNQLLMQDTAGNLERIIANLQEADRPIHDNTVPGNVQVFTLDRAGGAAVADAVRRLMSEMRPQSPVQVVPLSGPLSK
jgi:hypothetical protein